MWKRNLLLLVMTPLWAFTASAAELLAHADVVRTEPIESVRETVACREQPPVSADLVALLSWDLCTGDFAVTDRRVRITGYRVYYAWDGRILNRVMDRDPGPSIPIRITLD